MSSKQNFIQFLDPRKGRNTELSESKPSIPKEPFLQYIGDSALRNSKFRDILFTNGIQLVQISLNTGEEIGMESHPFDQFFYFLEGSGTLDTKDKKYQIFPGLGLVIPGGLVHNIINSGPNVMKLFTIYEEPEH